MAKSEGVSRSEGFEALEARVREALKSRRAEPRAAAAVGMNPDPGGFEEQIRRIEGAIESSKKTLDRFKKAAAGREKHKRKIRDEIRSLLGKAAEQRRRIRDLADRALAELDRVEDLVRKADSRLGDDVRQGMAALRELGRRMGLMIEADDLGLMIEKRKAELELLRQRMHAIRDLADGDSAAAAIEGETQQPSPASELPEEIAPQSRPPRLKRILFIGEDSGTRKIMIHFLCGVEDFEVQSAGDGDTGRRLAARDRPDLILLDVDTPGLGGGKYLEGLRRDPELSSVPIIVVGSCDREEEMAAALEVGAAGSIAKPVSVIEMLSKVKVALAPREAGRTAGASG